MRIRGLSSLADWRSRALLRRAQQSPTRAGVVLVYHRVGGPTSGDQDVEILPAVGRRVFERQLHHLAERYHVVPADKILDAVRSRQPGEPFPVAITFDDDLPEHAREALPVLREARLTATFFLNGASLGEAHSFWWENLQRAVDGGLLGADGLPHVDARAALQRSPRAITELSGAITRLEPSQREEVATTLREAVGPPPDDAGLRARDVRALAEGHCRIGFHTLRHEVLPALSEAELEAALRDGREALAAAAGTPVDTIGYPFGKADERVAERAKAAGFAVGFTTARGVVTPETDPFLIPRTVPDLSASGLAVRLARLFAAA